MDVFTGQDARPPKDEAAEYAAIEEAVLKAAPLFRLFGWIFVSSRQDGATSNDLRHVIESLVDDVRRFPDEDWGQIGTARFWVERSTGENGESRFRVLLDLAEWTEWPIEDVQPQGIPEEALGEAKKTPFETDVPEGFDPDISAAEAERRRWVRGQHHGEGEG